VGIIKPNDILEHRALGLTACFPAVTPNKLSLIGLEERLSHGVVFAIAIRSPYGEFSPWTAVAAPQPCPKPVIPYPTSCGY
jgi:hypothetical protein